MLCTLCPGLNFLFWDELSLNDQKIAREYRSSLKHGYPRDSTVDIWSYYVY